MASQYEHDIDLYKVIFMLSIYEFEEILIGDLTIFDANDDCRSIEGHKAVKFILRDLISGKQIE